MDSYKTVEGESTGDYREKGSKFFAYLRSCRCEEELKAMVAAMKKQHPSARHVCYGAVVGAEKPENRSSDAGEPSGTAGLPIINQILSAGLRDVAIVVVRYFGGTQLGKPGLIHAYKESARLAAESAIVVEKIIALHLTIVFAYDQTSAVMPLIERLPKAEIVAQEYAECCAVTVAVPKSALTNALHLFDHLPTVSVRVAE